MMFVFFFSSRRRHTRWPRDWSSDVCSSDLGAGVRSELAATECLAAEIGEHIVGLDRDEDQDQDRPVIVVVGDVAEMAQAHAEEAEAERAEGNALQVAMRGVAENADGDDDDDRNRKGPAEELPPMIKGSEG